MSNLMTLETNLLGRLRNTRLPLSHGLMPLFEAVVNSIHSIEDAEIPCKEGRIIVHIERDGQSELEGLDSYNPNAITSFRVQDNGVGFDEANIVSFRTLDSDHKESRGGRGVGRLLWLKAFRNVQIDSIFSTADGKLMKRSFSFDAYGVKDDEKVYEISERTEKKTIVHLKDFVKNYRDAVYKTVPTIANSLLEHCLWYFARSSGAPMISISDDETSIHLNQLYEEYMLSSATPETFSIKGQEFTITHTKLCASSNRSHLIGLCAADRLVKEEKLSGKIPGLYGKINDGESEFIYVGYVCSKYLDEKVRSERTDFDISENLPPLLKDQEISLSDIRDEVIDRASKYLNDYLNENRQLSEERVTSFVSHKAPRYRPILSRVSIDELAIDPSISDKDLELILHKNLSNIEAQMLADGHDLMKPQAEDSFPDYSQRLQEYLQTAEDIKKSDLVNYVFHRKVILDLLEKAIKKTDEGKYSREDLIHALLMPMRINSSEVRTIDANLWLIDERLAFHDYLASDKPLSSMPITGSRENKEPDIVVLNVFDNPINVFDNPILVSEGNRLPLASIVVVEIKRPMRNDANEGEEKDPIEQALGYLDRIREGQVSTSAGRPIPRSESIPGFCYVLCDITPTIEKRCKMHDAILTSDGLGYFFYHKVFSAYVEVISFDRLVNSARERNRAFFDKLGLPTT
jgi:hypothetical protein